MITWPTSSTWICRVPPSRTTDTGACASVAAAVHQGHCHPGSQVAVVLDGGTLEIRVTADGQVTMTGPAEMIYEGETIQ